MIVKLRRKFVAFAMLSIMLVTLFIFGIITIDMKVRTDTTSDRILEYIAQNGGTMPEYEQSNNSYITPESRFSTRYFTIGFDSSDNIVFTNLEHIAAVNEDTAKKMAQDIYYSNRTKGYVEHYRFLVSQTQDDENVATIIIFLDARNQIRSFDEFLYKANIIIVCGLVITFIIAYALSKKATGPVIDSIEKQKQFITNAGHDLKTPVAVIMADAEVLELELGENDEWVQSIKNQAQKLDSLIKSLLNLAKVDENNKKKPEFEEFDLVELVQDEIDGIKVLARNKKIEFSKPKTEIKITKDKTAISQVITILLDNAIKYAPDNSTIDVFVSKQGKNNVRLKVSNAYVGSKNLDPNKLFDRFYRADKSRNTRREGYGIGLSMAKSIIETNKGRISCNIDKEGKINFIVIL